MTRGLSLLVKLMEQAAETAKAVMLDPPSRTEAGQAFQRSRAQARLGRLDREIRTAKQQAAQAIPPALSAAFTAGVREADRQTTQIPDLELGTSGSRIGASLNLVDSRRARILVDNAVGDVAKSLDTTKRQVDRFVRQARALGLDGRKIQTLIAGGTLEGAPRASLAAVRAEVKKIAKEDGKVWVVDRNGELMRFKPDFYADLVFQTTQAEATNIGTLERLQQKRIDLVKIIGSSSANFCTAFVGKVYSMSGTHPTYPPISSLPRGGAPFHPRCSKRYVAFTPGLASAAEIQKAKPDAQSLALAGQSSSEAQRTFNAARRPNAQEATDGPRAP